MSYLPEFVALYEICPYIRNLPLNNESIRVAVRDYFSGDKEKDAIIKKYGRIEDWNTSKVTDMSFLFHNCFNFNEDISDWDTSNVTTMYDMFAGAFVFNQPIGKWDTSSVIDMIGMFYCTSNFNQLLDGWNTSKVTRMDRIFYGANNFNLENAPWYSEPEPEPEPELYALEMHQRIHHASQVEGHLN
jgi:surface protein